MGLSPPIISNIFRLNENSSYNLRCGVTVSRRNIRKSKFGFETVSTIGANNCPCKICRKFIKNLGYI